LKSLDHLKDFGFYGLVQFIDCAALVHGECWFFCYNYLSVLWSWTAQPPKQGALDQLLDETNISRLSPGWRT